MWPLVTRNILQNKYLKNYIKKYYLNFIFYHKQNVIIR